MPRLGILAGGGQLPLTLARSAAARGTAVHVVAIDGEADADFAGFALTRANWGQVGRILTTLGNEGGGCVVIAGAVRRPDLRRVRPDLGLLTNIAGVWHMLAAGGDDDVLTRLIRFLEARGITVVGVHEVAPELLVGAGPLGVVDITPDALADAHEAFALIDAMGPFDVGQAVAVADGRVLAIEGVEGTDAMLVRLAGARADGRASRGVLAKGPKPGQELRVDMPAIGPRTVVGAAGAGLAGIAVAARRTLALDRAGAIEAADRSGLFVAGVDANRAAPWIGGARDAAPEFEPCGRVRPGRSAAADAALGGALAAALAPFDAGHAIVVVRRHVLAVAAGESSTDLIARGAMLRRRSLGRPFGRHGVVVLRGAPASAELHEAVRLAVARHFAGVAVLLGPDRAIEPAVVATADRAGLFLLAGVFEPAAARVTGTGP